MAFNDQITGNRGMTLRSPAGIACFLSRAWQRLIIHDVSSYFEPVFSIALPHRGTAATVFRFVHINDFSLAITLGSDERNQRRRTTFFILTSVYYRYKP